MRHSAVQLPWWAMVLMMLWSYLQKADSQGINFRAEQGLTLFFTLKLAFMPQKSAITENKPLLVY
ncbi:hypothetical protein NX722_02290 [Endozoicomonas gorgoniicola]|uniref:Uncharacterized protein n=1 Tax=Endozoicomonas gorgoniicola TaxID=1234144 RepID=A0ABT3MR17_9GAMM|nr:hypothetical protein [Endozoicomonas gorgoniicola]MCW7551489.1 hypothetical protein [Endozoicomonas gorgoniicola]